jgi:hypothetical protein
VTNKRLHNEIHALKTEKGEVHWIQSEQPLNAQVADRAALRCAAMYGFDEVDPALVPAAVHDPKFVAQCISATLKALVALRPYGYLPHWKAGKLGVKPEFEPLSQ